MPLPSEMQAAVSRIWTLDSITYDNNIYVKCVFHNSSFLFYLNH